MELVDVLDSVRAEEIFIDEVSAVWCTSQIFPAKEIFMLGMFLAHDYVFDPDSKLTIFVVSWFI